MNSLQNADNRWSAPTRIYLVLLFNKLKWPDITNYLYETNKHARCKSNHGAMLHGKTPWASTNHFSQIGPGMSMETMEAKLIVLT